MLSLAITDHADGTGATATIAGTGGGAWSLYIQPFSGGGFSVAASGVGDGTATLPGAGYFYAYLLSGAAATGVQQYAATSGPLSCLVRLQNAIVAVLNTRTFTPQPNGAPPNIVGQKAASVLLTGLPAILVTLEQMSDQPSAKPYNFRQAVLYGYGIAVAILDRSDVQYQDANPYMQWRETAELALQTPTLAGVPELRETRIEGGPRVEQEMKKKMLTPNYMKFESGFVVRCNVIRRRG